LAFAVVVVFPDAGGEDDLLFLLEEGDEFGFAVKIEEVLRFQLCFALLHIDRI
jgi:hypothetical protein